MVVVAERVIKGGAYECWVCLDAAEQLRSREKRRLDQQRMNAGSFCQLLRLVSRCINPHCIGQCLAANLQSAAMVLIIAEHVDFVVCAMMNS
mmetsp:Transcript_39871/g.70121  ORF Transcript_39871/g.70121 Transcript_39871/m.70121 type:complete len:92 (-) Transcript_39871:506-781(-)